ncbi:MAG TPA: hypothetical protein VKC63_06745 [Solirubrobacterales bacterium]|nr:hypothetical protein [Solirubrobacterales bacterium]
MTKAKAGASGYVRDRDREGAVILATKAGVATGSQAAAAALACAGSEVDRAGLLIDLTGGRAPRPALIATTAARELEERLAVHLPEAGIASRGQLCQLTLPPERSGLDGIAAALPTVRGAVAVVNLPPSLLQQTLDESRIGATGALLRADLADDGALTALAAGALIGHGLRVAVLKQPLGWLAARRALFGALPDGGLPPRVVERLLGDAARRF